MHTPLLTRLESSCTPREANFLCGAEGQSSIAINVSSLGCHQRQACCLASHDDTMAGVAQSPLDRWMLAGEVLECASRASWETRRIGLVPVAGSGANMYARVGSITVGFRPREPDDLRQLSSRLLGATARTRSGRRVAREAYKISDEGDLASPSFAPSLAERAFLSSGVGMRRMEWKYNERAARTQAGATDCAEVDGGPASP